MQFSESMMIHSVESFLRAEEVSVVLSLVDAIMSSRPAAELQAAASGKSVHAHAKLDARQVAAVFEPEGRVEIHDLPAAAIETLDAAFFRNIDSIRRVYPSATWPRSWTYVEYASGQLCTEHADGLGAGYNVAACNVLLADGFTGGEFFVDTTGSEQLWLPSENRLGPASTYSNAWFRAIPKTRWTSAPAVGTAMFYGSQLVHGTLPVRSGTARKVLCWIEADSPLGTG